MALKIKESFQKNPTAPAPVRPQAAPAAVYINRAGRPVSLNSTTTSSNASTSLNASSTKVIPERPKDAEDTPSLRGKQLQNKLHLV